MDQNQRRAGISSNYFMRYRKQEITSVNNKKYDVELAVWEYQELLENRMIASMFHEYLRSPKKNGEFVILRLTRSTIDELAGFAAAESNHAKTEEEQELLGNACDTFEIALHRINKWGR